MTSLLRAGFAAAIFPKQVWFEPCSASFELNHNPYSRLVRLNSPNKIEINMKGTTEVQHKVHASDENVIDNAVDR
jgi:hypothetical protein